MLNKSTKHQTLKHQIDDIINNEAPNVLPKQTHTLVYFRGGYLVYIINPGEHDKNSQHINSNINHDIYNNN